VRAELEGLAAELAVTAIRDDQLAQLREAERHFRHAIQDVIDGNRDGRGPAPWSTESEWEQANDVFHRVIQDAAGNRQLLAAISFLHQTFPRHLTWAALSQSSHQLAANVAEHQRILAAIDDRDPAAARAEMTTHVCSAGELVARLLERA
jgi:DNA-binding GntR family transcriptional regulator